MLKKGSTFDSSGSSAFSSTGTAFNNSSSTNSTKRKRRLKRTKSNVEPQLYFQRWIQLTYLSLLALLSDWICFSIAASPEVYEEHYGHESSTIIDIFLYVNVISSFFVTDLVSKFGMQKTIHCSALLMTVGCWFRSGLPFTSYNANDSSNDYFDNNALVQYPYFVFGTVCVGIAQPFFQCTPPLLSAQWFGSNERAKSTAIALNFNQIGIATAFLVGGNMGTTLEGLCFYFHLISYLCTIVTIGTILQFQNLPVIPPSTSEIEKRMNNQNMPHKPFIISVKTFFQTTGFIRALTAFICSISITNIVGAFIDEVMERGGITDKFSIALIGAAFEFAIVIGGIVIGGYVDKTKKYKKVTLACLAISLILIIPLGLTDHALGKEPVLLCISLIGLGLVIGPVQPINAELAVDITYPEGDEIAVESVQQIGGNLISALLVPIAERASYKDYELRVPKIPVLASDIRGDVILLLIITLATFCFFNGFHAPLKRTNADSHDNDNRNNHNHSHGMGNDSHMTDEDNDDDHVELLQFHPNDTHHHQDYLEEDDDDNDDEEGQAELAPLLVV